MADAQDNQDVYLTAEYDKWAARDDFLPEESYLIRTYLAKDKLTLEAGTGGGRILLKMYELGYRNLRGYDVVPCLIEAARKRDRSGEIRFEVQDAVRLPYADAAFDQLVYLQQVTCVIESTEKQARALREAWRVLKPGGVALFSLLSFEVRRRSLVYGPWVLWLWLLRLLRGSSRSIQWLPRLKLGEKFHYPAFWDRGPYAYWYLPEEGERMLCEACFTVEAVGASKQIAEGRMCLTAHEVMAEGIANCHYYVCRK
jgi:SAM-dependent methyltransferase